MLLNINKPASITSHDVVDEVRRITGEKRVGHAGTLDPFATGVLVVGVTREGTRRLGEICKGTEKEYEATLFLGKESSTGDPEGELTTTASSEEVKKLFPQVIEQMLKTFTGEREQQPPRFSAIKVRGVPAYKRARRGEKVELPSRKIIIHKLSLLSFEAPHLTISVTCSSGTYIRSLAYDMGRELQVGAYLTKLVRTRVGSYRLEESVTLEALKSGLNA